MSISEVVTVSAARAGLTETLKAFRTAKVPEPVVFGSHRRPEAVIVPFDQYTSSRASVPALPQVRAHAVLINRLARANSLAEVRVFGSVARGDDTSDSDIDLLVTPEDGATLFDFAQFAIDIEQLLGRHVDVIADTALDPVRDAHILAEAVAL